MIILYIDNNYIYPITHALVCKDLLWATSCSSPQLRVRETLHPGRQGGGKDGRREEWRGREGDRRNSKVEGGKGMREGGKGRKGKRQDVWRVLSTHIHTLTNKEVVL